MCTQPRELTTAVRRLNLKAACTERSLRGDSIRDPAATRNYPMTTTLAGERAMRDRLLGRAQELGQAEMAQLLARTPRSAQLLERASRTLPFGVVSSFQKMQPYPIYVTHGRGSHVWDQDGSEYLDFHCGFGAMVVGHAHPRIVEAIHEAAGRGTHFAVTTESAV